MDFDSFTQFNDQFRSGHFDTSHRQITIGGLPYNLLTSSTDSWENTMSGKPGVIIYSTGQQRKEKALELGMDEWLALIWLKKGNTIIPVEVRPTTAARIGHQLGGMHSDDHEPYQHHPRLKESNEQQNVIGDVITLMVTSLPASMAIKGKVDTGATVSSLHADSWKIEGDHVKFVSKQLSPNVISMPLFDKQAVKSADGGVEYRPVIELNIKIGDKTMRNVMFNLNDRSKMDYPILVGQNVLEKGKFLIDPTINEQQQKVDWDQLFENLGPIELPTDETTNQQALEDVYNTLVEADVNFGDLVRFMRTNITESLDDITY